MQKRTTFTFKKDGETTDIPLEKWAWRVVYKPTEAQLKLAKEETIRRNNDLRRISQAKVKAMKNAGASEAQLAEEQLLLERATEKDVPPVCDEFKQFADDGTFHQMQEIDQQRVQIFIMYRPDRTLKQYSIFVDEEQNVQFFQLWRNIVLRASAHDEIRHRIYVYGMKDKESGQTVYNYILPDDRLVTSSRDIADIVAHIDRLN